MFSRSRDKNGNKSLKKNKREKSTVSNISKRSPPFIEDAMTHFLPETSGKPIVDLTLSSPEAPSKIVLRMDDNGKVIDVTDEPFPS